MKTLYSYESLAPRPRELVLRHAAILARDRGLSMLTIENVARASALRAADVRRIFWHRHDLVVAVFRSLLDRLQDRMADIIRQDPQKHGRLVRAYLALMTAPNDSCEDMRLLTAFTVAMAHDRLIAMIWNVWLTAQLDNGADPIDRHTLELICLTLDGLRLQDATQGSDTTLRRAVLQRLTRMTCPAADSLQEATG